MKTALKIAIIVILLIFAVISLRDVNTYKEKQYLFQTAAMYEEELIAFAKVLINVQQLEKKYQILQSRKINNEARQALLKDIKDFLEKSQKIENEFSNILQSYNLISKRYNDLPQPVLWYKDALPQTLKSKTKDDYLQNLTPNEIEKKLP